MKKKSVITISITFILLLLLMSCMKDMDTEETIDMSEFPKYVDDYENLTYSFTDDELMTPFWKGNVIYNESVLLVDDGNSISGKLLYDAVKIISVRDYSLKIEYVAGVDYKVEGNVIKRLTGSAIPYLTTENLAGKNLPSPYRKVDSISNVLTDYMLMGANVVYTESPLWYGNQISVSYVYDVKQVDYNYPDYDETTLPKFTQKLKNKEQINITAIGDSVLEGCSSSAHFNREPYMPNFMELTEKGLEIAYGFDITLNNLSVGGKTSTWGSSNEMLSQIKATDPDVVFIHFGINDAGNGASPNSFRDNIELIILSIRDAHPDTEFVILTAFSPNEKAYDTSRFEDYWEKLSAFEEQYKGVKIIDVFSLSRNILKVKKFEDITGNGINHVNDYSARIYLMSILGTFIKY